jgi:hypothetical protein
MQTTIQFNGPSTSQEWWNFKTKLNQVKSSEQPLLKKSASAESLVMHLNRQLQAQPMR